MGKGPKLKGGEKEGDADARPRMCAPAKGYVSSSVVFAPVYRTYSCRGRQRAPRRTMAMIVDPEPPLPGSQPIARVPRAAPSLLEAALPLIMLQADTDLVLAVRLHPRALAQVQARARPARGLPGWLWVYVCPSFFVLSFSCRLRLLG
jgi:hypothetical protein